MIFFSIALAKFLLVLCASPQIRLTIARTYTLGQCGTILQSSRTRWVVNSWTNELMNLGTIPKQAYRKKRHCKLLLYYSWNPNKILRIMWRAIVCVVVYQISSFCDYSGGFKIFIRVGLHVYVRIRVTFKENVLSVNQSRWLNCK